LYCWTPAPFWSIIFLHLIKKKKDRALSSVERDTPGYSERRWLCVAQRSGSLLEYRSSSTLLRLLQLSLWSNQSSSPFLDGLVEGILHFNHRSVLPWERLGFHFGAYLQSNRTRSPQLKAFPLDLSWHLVNLLRFLLVLGFLRTAVSNPVPLLPAHAKGFLMGVLRWFHWLILWGLVLCNVMGCFLLLLLEPLVTIPLRP
jgi:hypothetical protein